MTMASEQLVTSSPSDELEAGPFVTGFTIGLVMGAVGYYLVGTETGRSIVKTAQKEWETARQQVADNITQVVDDQLPETVPKVVGWWSKFKQEVRDVIGQPTPKVVTPRKKTVAKPKPKTKHTFSGV
jgi:gas vesicle protein